MRVAVIGPLGPDDFADNLVDTFRRMGCDVLPLGPAHPTLGTGRVRAAFALVQDLSQRLDEAQQRRLVDRARQFKPDLIMTIDRRLRPATVRKLGRLAPTCLWFPDAVANLGRHDAFLAGYDRIYLKTPPLVANLRNLYRLPVRYLPEAANSSWHRPNGEYGIDEHIVVAGNVHPTRAVLLDHLLERGIPLKIYGPEVPSWIPFQRVRDAHTGRYVTRQEKARVFRSARAVLNNLHPAEYSGSNCRLFEATGSGAAVLTEWREGMDDLFEAGSEVIPIEHTFDALVGQCEALLAGAHVGQEVARRAAVRTAQEHTYEHRIETVLDDLGLSGPSLLTPSAPKVEGEHEKR